MLMTCFKDDFPSIGSRAFVKKTGPMVFSRYWQETSVSDNQCRVVRTISSHSSAVDSQICFDPEAAAPNQAPALLQRVKETSE